MMRAASVLLGLLVAGSLYAGLSSAMAQNGERPKDVAVHGFQNHTACATIILLGVRRTPRCFFTSQAMIWTISSRLFCNRGTSTACTSVDVLFPWRG